MRNWDADSQRHWLNEEAYLTKIPSLLAQVTMSCNRIDARSMPYAVEIRHGKRTPHPRHWLALARLVGVSGTKYTQPQADECYTEDA